MRQTLLTANSQVNQTQVDIIIIMEVFPIQLLG